MIEFGLDAIFAKVILLTVVLSQLEYLILGRPQAFHQCRADQVALKIKLGKVVCWDLKKCPHGLGLSFHYVPGKIYSSGLKISCNPCLAGKTYSDKEDYSQCKKCSQCKKHEISTGMCYIDKDEIHCTEKCQNDFYWSNTTQSCHPCHQCCNTSLCSTSCALQKLLKLNCKSASNVTNSAVSNNTGINGMPEKEQNRNYGKVKVKTDKPNMTGKTAIVLFCSMVVGSSLAILTFVYKHHNKRRIMQGDQQRLKVSSAECTCPLLDYLCKASILPQLDQPGFAKSVASSAESTSILVHDTSKVLISLQGNEIPQTLDDMEGNAEEGNGIYAAEADSLIQMDKRRVKDLSDEECCKMCGMLDKKLPFFNDYRMLGEELGMEKREIEQLSSKQSPTLSILKKYMETSLEELGELLIKIGRNDVISVFDRNC